MKKHLILLMLVFPAFCSPAMASVREINLENMTLRSGYIFCGEVIDIRSHRGNFLHLGEVILTDVRIRVSETWKDTPGELREVAREKKDGKITEITIRYLGGRIGDSWQRSPVSPSFVNGEKVLVFAKRFNGSLATTGWFQGKYRLHNTQKRAGDSPQQAVVGGGKHLPIRNNTSLESLRTQVADILKRQNRPAEEGAEK